MSERERWIVYPLLFLTLGVSLRDKVTHTTSVDHIDAELIRCKALLVGHDLQTFQGSVPQGTITAFNEKGRPVARFGPNVICQQVEVDDPAGVTQVRIGSSPLPAREGERRRSTGFVTVHGEKGQEIITLQARRQPHARVRELSGGDAEQPKKALEVTDITEEGGEIAVFDSTRETALLLDHFPGQLGLYAKSRYQPLLYFPIAAIREIVRRPPNAPLDESIQPESD